MAWIFSVFLSLNVLLLYNFNILFHIFLFFLAYFLFGLANAFLKLKNCSFDILIFYLIKMSLFIHMKLTFKKTTNNFLYFYEKVYVFKFLFLFPFYFISQELLSYFPIIIYSHACHFEYSYLIFNNISLFHSHLTNLIFP